MDRVYCDLKVTLVTKLRITNHLIPIKAALVIKLSLYIYNKLSRRDLGAPRKTYQVFQNGDCKDLFAILYIT